KTPSELATRNAASTVASKSAAAAGSNPVGMVHSSTIGGAPEDVAACARIELVTLVGPPPPGRAMPRTTRSRRPLSGAVMLSLPLNHGHAPANQRKRQGCVPRDREDHAGGVSQGSGSSANQRRRRYE